MVCCEQLLSSLDNSTLKINHYKIIIAGILGCMLEFLTISDWICIGVYRCPLEVDFCPGDDCPVDCGSGRHVRRVCLRLCRGKNWAAADFYYHCPDVLDTQWSMYLTPDGSWIYLSFMRFFVGLGVGGLYTIDLALVQEFVPSRYRGVISGLLTAFIPIGVMIASAIAGNLTPWLAGGDCFSSPYCRLS